jgi:hypothetical protein
VAWQWLRNPIKELSLALINCPSCGKKQFNDSTRKCYACKTQLRRDGTPVIVPDGYDLDEHENIRSANRCEMKNGKLFVRYHYLLEDGKTTLRGEYSKLANPPKCVHPERLSCNYGLGFERCEFMHHAEGYWVCESKIA